MNLKKYLPLIIGCSIALLLAIGAAVLLVSSMSKQGKAQSELKSALSRLEQLNRRNPFPAQENVVLVQSNLTALKKVLDDTLGVLRKGQIEPDEIEPAEFGPLLERTIKRLRADATNNLVALPEKFAFGFDRYSAGDLPQSNAVGRLVTQLKQIGALCDIIYAARVTNLVSISREEFESQSAGGGPVESAPASLFGARPGGPASSAPALSLKDIPPAVSNELYATERFALQFSGRENAVFEVLNDLVKGPTFAVIRDLSLESVTTGQRIDAPGARPATAFGGAGAPYGEATPGSVASATNIVFTPRAERIVAGREDVRATLVVDVFRFVQQQGEAK